MASFLAKLGRDRPKKRKKKSSFPRMVSARPELEHSKKNSKFKKKKKRNSDFISSQTKLGRPKREKKIPNFFFFLTKK